MITRPFDQRFPFNLSVGVWNSHTIHITFRSKSLRDLRSETLNPSDTWRSHIKTENSFLYSQPNCQIWHLLTFTNLLLPLSIT